MKRVLEYEATCPKCRAVYAGDDRWAFCPVCGVKLDVVARYPKPIGRGTTGNAFSNRLLTVLEVAAFMGVSRQTVTRMFEKERGVIIVDSPEPAGNPRTAPARGQRPTVSP